MTRHSEQQPSETPRSWPDRLRLPLSFDPDRLAADFAGLNAQHWTAHFVPQHYDGDWSVLPLRAPLGARHPILRIAAPPDQRDWEDTEWLRASPYLQQVRDAFVCPIGAMRLMRLAPGSVIKPHRDHDLDAEHGVARLHIPIATNAAVDFRLNGTRVEMTPGSVWYLRLADPHGVINAGQSTRVHLVIDAIVDPWLEAMLDRACDGLLQNAAFKAEAR